MISVGVVEDHPVFRHGLTRLVESRPHLILTDACRSVEEACGRPTTPDVMLLDLHLPGLSGPDAVAAVTVRGSVVLVISAGIGRGDVIEAIGAGARGYLSKDADADEVATAIDVVAGGGTYVSATLASYLLEAARPTDDEPELNLSDREQEILVHLAHGERDQDIAEQLFISVRTVRSHLDRIRDKTGRRRRPDLTRFAIEKGLLDPE